MREIFSTEKATTKAERKKKSVIRLTQFDWLFWSEFIYLFGMNHLTGVMTDWKGLNCFQDPKNRFKLICGTNGGWERPNNANPLIFAMRDGQRCLCLEINSLTNVDGRFPISALCPRWNESKRDQRHSKDDIVQSR